MDVQRIITLILFRLLTITVHHPLTIKSKSLKAAPLLYYPQSHSQWMISGVCESNNVCWLLCWGGKKSSARYFLLHIPVPVTFFVHLHVITRWQLWFNLSNVWFCLTSPENLTDSLPDTHFSNFHNIHGFQYQREPVVCVHVTKHEEEQHRMGHPEGSAEKPVCCVPGMGHGS